MLYLTEDGEILNKKYVKDCFIYSAVGGFGGAVKKSSSSSKVNSTTASINSSRREEEARQEGNFNLRWETFIFFFVSTTVVVFSRKIYCVAFPPPRFNNMCEYEEIR